MSRKKKRISRKNECHEKKRIFTKKCPSEMFDSEYKKMFKALFFNADSYSRWVDRTMKNLVPLALVSVPSTSWTKV